MDYAAFNEGKAAFKVNGYGARNPYRKEIDRLASINKEADSKLYELASSWDSGFNAGMPSVYS